LNDPRSQKSAKLCQPLAIAGNRSCFDDLAHCGRGSRPSTIVRGTM
jgi:hypothetical protein